jgi:polyferredoxin
MLDYKHGATTLYPYYHTSFFFFFFILFIRSFIYLFILVFQDSVSLCSSGCPGTHFVDQAGLELRNPPTSASASRVLGLKACATTAQPFFLL